MLKHYITVSFRQFTKTLNQFFHSPSANENLQTLYTGCIQVWFGLLKELNQFGSTFTG